MADRERNHPRGRIAMGSGDLIDVVNVKVSEKNNGKIVHTMRGASGTVIGVKEVEITFEMVVSEDGAERDFAEAVKKGTQKQVRIKVPGETITANGIYTTRDYELPMDDTIKLSLSFVGTSPD